ELTILVCTIEKEPIPRHIRFKWMCELFPSAKVVHVIDEVPSYPHEHFDFWNIWTDLLRREISYDTEVFFSSEDYGYEVAERLAIKHIMVDKERNSVPISATSVRLNPFLKWDFIPNNVKPYFVKRIVLTGPESTGKTKMAELLAKHYCTTWVREYGREYFVNKKAKLELTDIIEIAKGQIKLEEEEVLKANRLLFCDFDLIVTQIWSEIYFKECPTEVLELTSDREYHLHLLMDIDIPWEDDGTREFPDLRAWHFNRIKGELEARKLNYVIVSGDYEKRWKTVEQIISKLMLQIN
ncbi:MAG: AAA family ATPase, partial [Bacteroidota bacterium]|nr:AAA family ATPase [Bacteroidota bacterium]